VSLKFIGGDRYVVGLPADDLSDADIARAAWKRLPREDRPDSVLDTPKAAINAERKRLVESGLYAADEPKETKS
jgi:hypothetical protein